MASRATLNGALIHSRPGNHVQNPIDLVEDDENDVMEIIQVELNTPKSEARKTLDGDFIKSQTYTPDLGESENDLAAPTLMGSNAPRPAPTAIMVPAQTNTPPTQAIQTSLPTPISRQKEELSPSKENFKAQEKKAHAAKSRDSISNQSWRGFASVPISSPTTSSLNVRKIGFAALSSASFEFRNNSDANPSVKEVNQNAQVSTDTLLSDAQKVSSTNSAPKKLSFASLSDAATAPHRADKANTFVEDAVHKTQKRPHADFLGTQTGPSTGISINKSSEKGTTKNNYIAPSQLSILNPKRKTTLRNIPLGHLFSPGQVVSDRENAETKRRRTEKKLQRSLQGDQPVETPSTRGEDQEWDEFYGPLDAHSDVPEGSNHTEPQSQGSLPIESSAVEAFSQSSPANEGSISLKNSPHSPYPPPVVEQIEANPRAKTGGKRLPSHQESLSEATPRATTGGKGISAASLQAKDGMGSNLEVHFEYFVDCHERMADELDEDAKEMTYGPFYTLEEANAVATDKAMNPIDWVDPYKVPEVGTPGRSTHAVFSHNVQQNEYGMQIHTSEVMGQYIACGVRRSIAAPGSRVKLPAKALRVPSHTFLAYLLTFSPKVLHTTLGNFTTLSAANKKAGEEWIKLEAPWKRDATAAGMTENQYKKQLREEIKVMNQDGECFKRGATAENNAQAGIWVEMVDVTGPRN